jgi:hypothetical protein
MLLPIFPKLSICVTSKSQWIVPRENMGGNWNVSKGFVCELELSVIVGSFLVCVGNIRSRLFLAKILYKLLDLLSVP